MGRKETGGKTTGAKERGVGETGGKETRVKPMGVKEMARKVSGGKAMGAQVSQEGKVVLPIMPFFNINLLHGVLHLLMSIAWCVTFVCRLSFPSGHASLVTYCMVFLVMYMQARMTCRSFHLIRAFLQVAALWLAIGVCLSRISDYKHHWGDVLGGAVLGAIVAALVVRHVLALPQRPRLAMCLEDRKKRETPTRKEATGGVANEGFSLSIQEPSQQRL
ncbi:hypothetical protein LSAT2_027349 [Lamellibrachia satsuma]|nr:hypothetical protein LSAT2_027349 [Lamellibrachia satsuma]